MGQKHSYLTSNIIHSVVQQQFIEHIVHICHSARYQFSSVTHSCPTLCDPHGLQHARPPSTSPTPGVYSNSCPLSWWCHQTISCSVDHFSTCLQYFPASRSFPMSWLLTSGCQSIGASASTSVLPMNIQDCFPLGLTGWSPCNLRGSQESSQTPQFKSINSLALSFLYSPTLTSIHDY